MADALTVHQVTAGAMAQRAVAVIQDWLAKPDATPAEVAVLSRVNSALLPVQISLQDAEVPTTAPLDATVLGRTGIRTALAYLRIGLDPERIRREDVFDTINRPARKVKGAITPFLKRGGRLSMNRLQDIAAMLDGSRATRFEDYLYDLQTLSDAITDGADTERCLRLIRTRIGLGEAMDTLDSSGSRPEGSSHGDDLDALEQLASLHPDPVTFREWLVEHLRRPGDDDGVTLSTVHRVKGMEWDRVVVFAANTGLMPHRLADDREEERRIFHVALTRCREEVAVVANRDAPSPFIPELRKPATHRDETTSAASTVPDGVTPRPGGDGATIADRGLAVQLAGGFDGVVAQVRDEAVVVRLRDGDVEVDVPFGTPVMVAGERTHLEPPPRKTSSRPRLRLGASTDEPEEDVLSPADELLFEQLREWRARTATAQGVPAYVVLHDAHLKAIAARRPASERELSRCPGIGPTKLDRYGDDLLALVAEAGDQGVTDAG